tara:strand:+ start:88 stop:2268 length:2181 start_codon:yes stop_codon:yes gene_type:complete
MAKKPKPYDPQKDYFNKTSRLKKTATHGWDEFFDPETGQPWKTTPSDNGYNTYMTGRDARVRRGEAVGAEGGALLKEDYITEAKGRAKSSKLYGQDGFALRKNVRPSNLVVQQLAQDDNALFSLTAGFFPSLGKQHQTEYATSQAGVITVEESHSDVGPARMQLRGNHVWFEYAADYIKTVQDLFQPAIEKDPNYDPDRDGSHKMRMNSMVNYSILGDIFDKYSEWIKKPSTTSKTAEAWRDAVTDGIKSTVTDLSGQDASLAGDLSSTRAGGEQKFSEAPEEMMPEILKRMYPDVFGEIETLDTELAHKGKASSMDIAFRFQDLIYVIEVTQERLTDSTSHTSVLRKLENKGYKNDVAGEAELRKDLQKHFDENRKAINSVLKFIGDRFVKQKKETNMRDFAEGLGMKWRMKSDEVKAMIGTGSKSLIGKKEREGLDAKFNFDQLYKSGKEKFVMGGLSGAITSVMHLLGTDWGKTFKSKGGKDLVLDTFSDLFVLSDDNPINVGYKYTVKGSLEDGSIRLAAGTAEDVMINPDSSFYMDAFMRTMIEDPDVNFTKEQAETAIRVTNMLWLAHAGGIENLELTTGLAQYKGISTQGIVVAGGAIIFEDKDANAAIGSFLQDIIMQSDAKLRTNPKIKNAMKEAQSEKIGFTAMVKRIDENPKLNRLKELAQDNPDRARFIDQTQKMNKQLKAHSWAAPYVGIYYQGGFRAGVFPLFAPTQNDGAE